jgi:hypothetical protein
LSNGQTTGRKNTTMSREEIVRIASIPDAIQISEIGITFTGQLDYEDWLRLMGTLTRLEKSVQFAIGDALNYGEGRADYGEKYTQAIDATGLTYQALANYSWVSQAVPIGNRRGALSWSHHRLVAKLPKDEQVKSLAIAEENDWTLDALKEYIEGKPANPRTIETVIVPTGISPREAADVLKSYAKSQRDSDAVQLCGHCPLRDAG